MNIQMNIYFVHEHVHLHENKNENVHLYMNIKINMYINYKKITYLLTCLLK